MLRILCAFVLLLKAGDAQAQIDKSFSELFDAPPSATSIRSLVHQHKKRALDACNEDLNKSKSQLRSVHQRLQQLDATQGFTVGNVNNMESRADLHENIATLEQTIRSQAAECEHEIPLRFAIEAAKARLAHDWPQRREQNQHAMLAGSERDRHHGDIDDIGFRNVGGGLEGQLKDLPAGMQAIRQMRVSGMMPAESQDAGEQRHVQDLALRIAR